MKIPLQKAHVGSYIQHVKYLMQFGQFDSTFAWLVFMFLCFVGSESNLPLFWVVGTLAFWKGDNSEGASS